MTKSRNLYKVGVWHTYSACFGNGTGNSAVPVWVLATDSNDACKRALQTVYHRNPIMPSAAGFIAVRGGGSHEILARCEQPEFLGCGDLFLKQHEQAKLEAEAA